MIPHDAVPAYRSSTCSRVVRIDRVVGLDGCTLARGGSRKARASLSILLGGALAAGSALVSAVAVADDPPRTANVAAPLGPLDTCGMPSEADMPTVGGNLGNQHYSALTQIGDRCSTSSARFGARTSRPSSRRRRSADDSDRGRRVIDLDTPNGEVIAIDGRTGAANWKWAPEAWRQAGARDVGGGPGIWQSCVTLPLQRSAASQ